MTPDAHAHVAIALTKAQLDLGEAMKDPSYAKHHGPCLERERAALHVAAILADINTENATTLDIVYHVLKVQLEQSERLAVLEERQRAGAVAMLAADLQSIAASSWARVYTFTKSKLLKISAYFKRGKGG